MRIFKYDAVKRGVFISEITLVRIIRKWIQEHPGDDIRYLRGQRKLAQEIKAALEVEPIEDMNNTLRHEMEMAAIAYQKKKQGVW